MKRRLFFLFAMAILPAALHCGRNGGTGGETAGKRQAGQELARPRNDIPGLKNFAKVSEQLYRGAQPTQEGFAELKKMGIKTIVNLRAFHSDEKEIKGLGLRYVKISFKPWRPEEEDVLKFLKVVADPKNQPVFVHCQHGADRTGTMVVIYRAAVQGWDIKDAMEELPGFGFHEVWSDLKDYLLGLDVKAIPEKVKSEPAPELEEVK
jgi:tyrosine-protein phosphatase SIW14